MDKIEKIRQEIDRRYNEYSVKKKTDDFIYYSGMADALDLFEQFIDTLEEEPDKSLEDAAREYCKTIFHKPFSENPQEEHIVYDKDKYYGFIAGAKWGAEHLKK